MVLRNIVFVVLALSALSITSAASAHPLVDEARGQLGEALFVDALDTLARAAARDDLSRDDLAELLAVRALVNRALGNDDAMQADLSRLAVVAPDYAFDRRAVPEVRRAFADARANGPGAIRLAASPELGASGVTISAEVDNDGEGLVRHVRISGRDAGATSWERVEDAPLFVAADGATVVYYVEAIGPGGAVVASSGSADDPHRFGGGSSDAETGGGSTTDEDGGGVPMGVWIGLGVGVAVVAGVVIALAVVLGGGSGESSQLEPFVVRF